MAVSLSGESLEATVVSIRATASVAYVAVGAGLGLDYNSKNRQILLSMLVSDLPTIVLTKSLADTIAPVEVLSVNTSRTFTDSVTVTDSPLVNGDRGVALVELLAMVDTAPYDPVDNLQINGHIINTEIFGVVKHTPDNMQIGVTNTAPFTATMSDIMNISIISGSVINGRIMGSTALN